MPPHGLLRAAIMLGLVSAMSVSSSSAAWANSDAIAKLAALSQNVTALETQFARIEPAARPDIMTMMVNHVAVRLSGDADIDGWHVVEEDTAPDEEGDQSREWTVAPAPAADGFIVELTMTGYLDDSVAGEKFLGTLQPNGKNWSVETLWRQNLCWRGETTRQWTSKSCP